MRREISHAALSVLDADGFAVYYGHIMEGSGERFVIQGLAGKKKLHGTIAVRGAKNAALKAMAASILFKNPLTLSNVPDIEDVRRMADLLEHVGIAISRPTAHSMIIHARALPKTALTADISKRLRASVVLTGPLLARTKEVSFPHPGGCVIGARPIDMFLEGFEKMGARVRMKDKMHIVRAPKKGLTGATLFFRQQSVTATETFMMAGVLARGTTILKNAAMEPEIAHLAEFLNRSGARISGAGTSTITIKGTSLLSVPRGGYSIVPDRVEAGSFLILGALAASDLSITHCVPEHVRSLIETLISAGVSVSVKKDTIRVRASKNAFRAIDIKTHEYPGFPTDTQAPMTVFLTQAKGESMVFETIFEGRLNYVEELNRMGADIRTMDPHRVIVRGETPLHGRELQSPDLRAGLAFVIAATIATGRSVVHNVYNIDRGYERIEERLQDIGVKISRVA
ncbi:MAG: UDP-N-acetylglucosamine 1-carboxyvinyltransferase [Patescibacteria group bacterium]